VLCGGDGTELSAEQLLHRWQHLQQVCEAGKSSLAFQDAVAEEMLLYQSTGGWL
jgi:hypothetical protein